MALLQQNLLLWMRLAILTKRFIQLISCDWIDFKEGRSMMKNKPIVSFGLLALSSSLVFSLASTIYAGFGDEVAKLLPNDRAPENGFGASVGIDARQVIVGAPFSNDNGEGSGSVYLFDAVSGTLSAKLTPSDGAENEYFGTAVAISGDTAIVSGRDYIQRSPELGDYHINAVFLFDVSTGTQLAKLRYRHNSPFGSDDFGISVGISGDIAIVGASGDQVDRVKTGSAYLIDVPTGRIIADSRLVASDAKMSDGFGRSVDIDGNTAIVGTDGNGAYLFDVTTGEELAKLTASDWRAASSFGRSVAISGNTAIVGASEDDENGSKSGSAFLFDVATGEQLAKLTASDGELGDNFGVSVDINGTMAIVGAYDHYTNRLGSAYLFDIHTGTQLAKITAGSVSRYGRFGSSMAISENRAVIGAFAGSDGAYLYSTIPEPGTVLLSVWCVVGTLLWRRR